MYKLVRVLVVRDDNRVYLTPFCKDTKTDFRELCAAQIVNDKRTSHRLKQ